jgi:hypothetical protein
MGNKEDLELQGLLVFLVILEFLACLAEMARKEMLVCLDCLETEVTLDSQAHQECLEETVRLDQKVQRVNKEFLASKVILVFLARKVLQVSVAHQVRLDKMD